MDAIRSLDWFEARVREWLAQNIDEKSPPPNIFGTARYFGNDKVLIWLYNSCKAGEGFEPQMPNFRHKVEDPIRSLRYYLWESLIQAKKPEDIAGQLYQETRQKVANLNPGVNPEKLPVFIVNGISMGSELFSINRNKFKPTPEQVTSIPINEMSSVQVGGDRFRKPEDFLKFVVKERRAIWDTTMFYANPNDPSSSPWLITQCRAVPQNQNNTFIQILDNWILDPKTKELEPSKIVITSYNNLAEYRKNPGEFVLSEHKVTTIEIGTDDQVLISGNQKSAIDAIQQAGFIYITQ